MTKHIAILGTLDTKGQEIAFLREAVCADGGDPLVVDTGVLGTPTISADVSRHRVAQAAGSSIAAVIEAGDKAHALIVMAEGTTSILQHLLDKGQLGGVLSIGGSRGTALGTQVMQNLPVGVPKLMVSTMASGRTPFGPYTGTKDVTIMPSVADILGVNAVTRPILANAAAAIVAMSRVGAPIQRGEMQTVAATMLGASTTLVEQICGLMAADDGQVIAFHAVGAGGRAMEELIGDGLFDGVFDVTPAEIAAWMADGPYSAGPDRMQAAGRRGIPQVVAPGGLDFIIEGPPETLPTKYAGRKTMRHTPTISLVRTSPEEMAKVARLMAERLAESAGPAAAILPLRGFSAFSIQGEPLHDPQSDGAFIKAFRKHASPAMQIVELDTHLNDPQVGETAVSLMRAMLPDRAAMKPRRNLREECSLSGREPVDSLDSPSEQCSHPHPAVEVCGSEGT
jgi:uncharacterized protein (UPF0261 family)